MTVEFLFTCAAAGEFGFITNDMDDGPIESMVFIVRKVHAVYCRCELKVVAVRLAEVVAPDAL